MSESQISWNKKKFGGISKTKKLADGAIVALLASASDIPLDIEKVYDRFREIVKIRGSIFRLVGVAGALALLSYFDIVEDFSTSGFNIDSEYLGHISLALVSASNLLYAAWEPKIAFIKSWFDHRYQTSSPEDKTSLLLKYPEVFDFPYFSFANIGYPKDIYPKRFPSFLPYAFLVLIGLALIVFGSITLFGIVAFEVWNSQNLPIVSKSLVIIAALCSLIAFTSPKFWGFKREYIHYGLSNLLTRFKQTKPDRYSHFSRTIARVRIRMGLADFDE